MCPRPRLPKGTVARQYRRYLDISRMTLCRGARNAPLTALCSSSVDTGLWCASQTARRSGHPQLASKSCGPPTMSAAANTVCVQRVQTPAVKRASRARVTCSAAPRRQQLAAASVAALGALQAAAVAPAMAAVEAVGQVGWGRHQGATCCLPPAAPPPAGTAPLSQQSAAQVWVWPSGVLESLPDCLPAFPTAFLPAGG